MNVLQMYYKAVISISALYGFARSPPVCSNCMNQNKNHEYCTSKAKVPCSACDKNITLNIIMKVFFSKTSN